jgi:hypothetical protein
MDSNVLIQAKNGYFSFDVAPGFWDLLDEKLTEGEIYCSSLVYKELADGNDELAKWVKERRSRECFPVPSKEVQENYTPIADYVTKNYKQPEAMKFLAGADAWVIAQAKTDSTVVVTWEKEVDGNSTKVKIPNICRKFNVKFIDLHQMLRELNVRLELRR